MKILLATQKPFAAAAVNGIRSILEEAGNEVVLLEKYAGEDELVAAVADVDAMIIRSDKVTARVLDAAPKLKIVVRAGAGFDNVDLAAATAHGVVVENTPGQNSNAVAELAIAMMIYMSRNQFTPATGTEISGKTVGIQAFGNVGRLVGQKAAALGMKVKAVDPFIPAEKIAEVTKQLEDGTLHVFDTSTFTVGGAALDSYQADVDTDANYTPDTEVVHDGYFSESEFRSAPYFDLQIDGINLLDTNFGG